MATVPQKKNGSHQLSIFDEWCFQERHCQSTPALRAEVGWKLCEATVKTIKLSALRNVKANLTKTLARTRAREEEGERDSQHHQQS